ncbi:hypothetical protein AAIA72_07620 [Hahella sp. SMD15-11]|uniref:GCVT N-terminal domain-containing protein n=1 Tax=Thermohahella caldifontis TaxID=3142973 RepID=A0AB39UZX1_9GAMM
MFVRNDLTALTLEGPDTQRFLQGQLTCDVNALAPGQSVWGGCCTPKGRLVATFLLARTGEHQFVLVVPDSMTDLLQAHLNKYRVFFKTNWQTTTWNLVCTDADTQPPASGTSLPAPGGWSQCLQAANGLPEVPEDVLARLQVAEIRAGFPVILPATTELFLPQAVGLDHLGGVSFSKGCYTGQEVVARARYRGKVKKALYVLQTDAPCDPGARIAGDRDEAWGTVLRSAEADGITWTQAVLDRPPEGVALRAGNARVIDCQPAPGQ